MSPNKCKNCGIVNAVYDHTCRRCGCVIVREAAGPRSPRDAAKRASSFLYTLLAIALFSGIGYYLFNGFENSYEQVKQDELRRLAAQPKVSPASLTSRSESDQQRTEGFKNAVANNSGLATSQRHNDDIKKLMQPKK